MNFVHQFRSPGENFEEKFVPIFFIHTHKNANTSQIQVYPLLCMRTSKEIISKFIFQRSGQGSCIGLSRRQNGWEWATNFEKFVPSCAWLNGSSKQIESDQTC